MPTAPNGTEDERKTKMCENGRIMSEAESEAIAQDRMGIEGAMADEIIDDLFDDRDLSNLEKVDMYELVTALNESNLGNEEATFNAGVAVEHGNVSGNSGNMETNLGDKRCSDGDDGDKSGDGGETSGAG